MESPLPLLSSSHVKQKYSLRPWAISKKKHYPYSKSSPHTFQLLKRFLGKARKKVFF